MTNGGWTQILDQDITVSGGYLPATTWRAGVATTAPNAGQWSSLNRVADLQNTDLTFEFRLTYGTPQTNFIQWSQTGNPTTGTRGTLSGITQLPANQAGGGASPAWRTTGRPTRRGTATWGVAGGSALAAAPRGDPVESPWSTPRRWDRSSPTARGCTSAGADLGFRVAQQPGAATPGCSWDVGRSKGRQCLSLARVLAVFVQRGDRPRLRDGRVRLLGGASDANRQSCRRVAIPRRSRTAGKPHSRLKKQRRIPYHVLNSSKKAPSTSKVWRRSDWAYPRCCRYLREPSAGGCLPYVSCP
jgi:hypothetical protein